MPNDTERQDTSSNEENRPMSEDANSRDASGIDRRHFLTAAAGGVGSG